MKRILVFLAGYAFLAVVSPTYFIPPVPRTALGRAFMAYLKAVEQGKSEEMVRYFFEEALATMPASFVARGEQARNMLEIMQVPGK